MCVIGQEFSPIVLWQCKVLLAELKGSIGKFFFFVEAQRCRNFERRHVQEAMRCRDAV